MVLNNPLRYLEKGLLDNLRNATYRNADDIFGFIVGRSTHDAYTELRDILKDDSDTKITFLDLSKAYNTVDRQLLLKIMKLKLDSESYNCVENIVNRQNIKVINRYIKCN